MSQSNAVNVKSFINERPMSGAQYALMFLCFLIVAADGIDVAIMGFIAPPIVQEWRITRAAFGVVMSAAPIGLVLGALIAGPSSDRFGRKKVLVTSVLLFGVFTLICAFTSNPVEMAVMRLLTGLGLGAAMPNSTTLLSEYVPERSRSLFITIMFTGFGVGSAGVGFAAAWLIPLYGWRSVLIMGGALPLVLLPFLLMFLPESARFMVVRGFTPARIAATLGRVCRTTFAAGTTFFAPEPPVTTKRPIGVLFSRGFGLMTISLWVTYFMGLLVIYLLTGWLPTLIKDAGLPIAAAANITAMFQTGGIVGAILAGWLMDRVKPTWIISGAYVGGALCVLGVGATGALSSSLAIWVLAAGFFMNGAQTGLNAFAPNCYPTIARATGVSWMLGMGRFGSILGSGVGGLLLSLGWGFGGIVSALAIPAVLAAFAILTSRVAAKEPVTTERTSLAHG